MISYDQQNGSGGRLLGIVVCVVLHFLILGCGSGSRPEEHLGEVPDPGPLVSDQPRTEQPIDQGEQYYEGFEEDCKNFPALGTERIFDHINFIGMSKEDVVKILGPAFEDESLDANYEGFSEDLKAFRETYVDSESGKRLSTKRAYDASLRIFRKANFFGMTPEEVIQLLGDPGTINDFGRDPSYQPGNQCISISYLIDTEEELVQHSLSDTIGDGKYVTAISTFQDDPHGMAGKKTTINPEPSPYAKYQGFDKLFFYEVPADDVEKPSNNEEPDEDKFPVEPPLEKESPFGTGGSYDRVITIGNPNQRSATTKPAPRPESKKKPLYPYDAERVREYMQNVTGIGKNEKSLMLEFLNATSRDEIIAARERIIHETPTFEMLDCLLEPCRGYVNSEKYLQDLYGLTIGWGDQVKPILERLADDEYEKVRMWVANGYRYLDEKGFPDVLVKLTQDESSQVREVAYRVLYDMNKDAIDPRRKPEIIDPELNQRWLEIKKQMEAGPYSLASNPRRETVVIDFDEHPQLIPLYIQCMTQSPSASHRSQAVRVLTDIYVEQLQAGDTAWKNMITNAMIEAVENENDLNTRTALVRSASRISLPAEKILPLLEKLKDDPACSSIKATIEQSILSIRKAHSLPPYDGVNLPTYNPGRGDPFGRIDPFSN